MIKSLTAKYKMGLRCRVDEGLSNGLTFQTCENNDDVQRTVPRKETFIRRILL